jgi:AAA+ superfamily predicted ATPase
MTTTLDHLTTFGPASLGDEFARLDALISDRLAACVGGGPVPRPVEEYGFDLGLFANLRAGSTGDPLTAAEHVIVLLALVPHVRPNFITGIIGRHVPDGGDLPEIGGARGDSHHGFLPTGETAQFVLAGDDLPSRVDVHRLLSASSWLARRRIVSLGSVHDGEPAMSGRLVLEPEVVERITTGTVSLPHFGTDFPAEHVVTEMEWDDVVLRPDTREQLRDIERWVVFNNTVLHEWGMRKRVRPGCRVLFHGPPGTGKTLAATLIGKSTDRPVFRIDLSRIVSRYIGETEKNLARLFDRAEHKDWILFFDEADALFGERSKVRDAHDKYANQEVAFLLQRIENCAGLVILAANRRSNIDPAFIRRLRYVVEFSTPNSDDRLQLWRRVFPEQLELAEDIDWSDVAQRYELSAASIVNVAQQCAIGALGSGDLRVDAATVEAAISRELVKDVKVE